METDINKPPLFQISVDAVVLAELMREVPIGETITYEELGRKIKREELREYRHIITSAMRKLRKEESIVFACVPTVGYKRLADDGVVDLARSGLTRIGNQARRSARVLAAANYDKLVPEKKIEHNALAGALGAIALSVKPKSFALLQEQAAQNNHIIAGAEALQLWAKK